MSAVRPISGALQRNRSGGHRPPLQCKEARLREARAAGILPEELISRAGGFQCDLRAGRPQHVVVFPSRVHPFAQFRRGEAKGTGQPGDVLDAGVAEAALNPADVGGIEPGLFGELFLRELFRLALTADVQSQRSEDSVAFRHD